MADHRTGVPRREIMTGIGGTASSTYTPSFDNMGNVEPASRYISNDKERNERFSAQTFNPESGIVIRRWGSPDGQEFEQGVKVSMSLAEIQQEAIDIANAATAGIDGVPEPITPDQECCAWLHINAPSTVESGSTSGINAGNKKGCVYVWSVEECNPGYWGCGTITAAGTGGSGAGIHETSKGVVFIAPTIPDKDTINCGRTVDTKIKVAILTADGKKQLASENGTAGWSGFGMGPGDLLYDLFGPDEVCSDTANITTKAGDCPILDECLTVHIDYTTLSLTFYEELVLTAGSTQPLTGEHTYMWVLSGVGALLDGTLTTAYGKQAIYRAPGFVEDCTNYSATIMLFCDGYKVDTITISVRGVFPDPVPRAGTYFWLTPGGTIGCGHPFCPAGTCYWAYVDINIIEVDCNGKLGPYTVMGWGGWACQCSTEEICIEKYPGEYPCYDYFGYQYAAGGCCPDSGGVTTC